MFKFYADNTITREGHAIPFGRIDRDSYQMPSGQRGKTTVRVYESGSKIEMVAPLYVPAVPGSVSDWKVNPEFCAELAEKLDQ